MLVAPLAGGMRIPKEYYTGNCRCSKPCLCPVINSLPCWLLVSPSVIQFDQTALVHIAKLNSSPAPFMSFQQPMVPYHRECKTSFQQCNIPLISRAMTDLPYRQSRSLEANSWCAAFLPLKFIFSQYLQLFSISSQEASRIWIVCNTRFGVATRNLPACFSGIQNVRQIKIIVCMISACAGNNRIRLSVQCFLCAAWASCIWW